jgi:hypothetical protein
VKDMSKAPKFCQNCGAPLEPDNRFCGGCGHKVSAQPSKEKEAVSQPSPVEPTVKPSSKPNEKSGLFISRLLETSNLIWIARSYAIIAVLTAYIWTVKSMTKYGIHSIYGVGMLVFGFHIGLLVTGVAIWTSIALNRSKLTARFAAIILGILTIFVLFLIYMLIITPFL